jgi:hypothetical protein
VSGPWDRPSSDDSDAAWPGEDVGRSSGSGASRDPASEGAPGWDDWPSAPPPDDYLIEEPLPPSSDPWAESWTDEDADAMLRAAAGESAPPSETDRWEPIREPEPAPAPEPASEPPSADRWEPIREPEPEPAWQPAAEQPLDDRPEVDAGPRVEPWSAEADPWRFEPGPGIEPEPEPRAMEPEPEAEPRAAEPEPATAEPAASGPASVAEASGPAIPAQPRWPPPSREVPDWLAEPAAADTPKAPERPEPRVDEPQETEPVGAAATDDGATEAVESEPEVVEPQADPWTEPTEPEARAESGSFWSSILPWRSSAPAPAEAPPEEAPSGPEPEPEPEPAEEHPWIEVDDKERPAEPEPEPVAPPIEPRWPASVPEPVVAEDASDIQPEAEAEAEGQEAAAPAFVPIGGGLRYEPEPEAAIQPEPEPEPEPETMEPEPEAPRDSGEPDWADRGESTRVFPTDWTPTPPVAIEPPRTGELEPTAGPVRTRLAEREGDELDDELVAPTIAEQAVPWLIGVILLLAGMVIVLLALIFAGDGSLGGSTPSPTPNPTLAAVPAGGTSSPAPTPSSTPAPTVSDAPSPTPEATATPDPLPQYGPLEMVYQGRAAALAPIYLLRRDFTVDEEPAILAQDGSLDVRRFAWVPDGTAGAGLLADVLVSIEPGQEKRRLGEGLVTITFGDDGSTVYAVRVTPDGGNDTATVLAIGFTSGDTEELASVTYARPQTGDEPALAEARFSDDGGAVRLYWMHEDVLRLWVLGVGAWAIDPADGGVTELDGEPLPTLVGPSGRQRISLAEDDGTTTLTLLDMNERPRATTSVDGLVSHLRWSPAGDRVVFTIARSAPGGGILQDLFLWDLGDGQAPAQLTNTGAAFGAEWLGTQPRWRDQP